ncbi:MAG: F0F1 ATP synthase subunit A [Proteobacteria bacterium]|nr:F0F1 ATP synthase subunit A [Pseudomonadota bacterium]
MSGSAHEVAHAAGQAAEHAVEAAGHAAAAAGHGAGGPLDFSHLIGHHLADAPVFMLGPLAFTKQMLWMSIAAALGSLLLILAARGPGKLRTAFDFLVLFLREDVVRPALGEDTDFYLPYFLTLFLFIFMMNLMGLIPSGMTPTGSISVTAALSMCTFVMIQGTGMVRHGVVGHFKNLVPHGVPLAVVPLVFLIELMGYFTKCIALCIRLFANMTAGHLVILLFLGLILLFGQANPWAGSFVAVVSVPLTVAMYCLELIVALVQAYVFTMLTAIFVGGALHPSH